MPQLKTTSIIFSLLLLSVSVSSSARPGKPVKPRENFVCDNTMYMSSHPYSQNVTELSVINPYTSRDTKIATSSQYGYDAIGFNHLDGYIYGISNYQPDGGQPRLIRINPANGDITDLGTFPQFAGKEWIIGTIVKDGHYVIGDFGTSTWLSINLQTLAVDDEGHIPTSLVTAWATNPLDNVIYGYQSYTMQLMSFNLETKQFHSFDKPLTNVGVQPCSTAFHQDGKMFLYCKTSDVAIDRMFEINIAAQTATEISSGIPLGAGDLATCAFKSETPTPPKEIPGSWQHGRKCIEISENGEIALAYRKCAPLLRCDKKVGTVSYDKDGNAIVNYSDATVQQLTLLTPRKLEVKENSHRTSIYKKVDRCRYEFHFPWPPHPTPPTPPKPPKPKNYTPAY